MSNPSTRHGPCNALLDRARSRPFLQGAPVFDLVSANPMIQSMDRSMSLASKRMTLIASNLANIDTPGYRTQEFSFEEALKAEYARMGGQPTAMSRTHAAHFDIQVSGSASTPRSTSRPSSERNDGNDVSLDRETMALSRTQSNYQLSSAFAQTELRKLIFALREGAK